MKIIVVDDDKDILAFTGDFLRLHFGEDVVETYEKSADVANAIMREGYMFDVLVTDNDMPVVDGLALAAVTKCKIPGVKTIMISGRSAEDVFSKVGSPVIDYPIDHFLRKPFRIGDLYDAVMNQ